MLGDRLYVGTMSNQVLAINLKKMRIEWEFEAPKRKQPFYASAAVTDDLVVIGSRDNKVWAIDRKTGQRKWDFLTDHKVDGSAVIAGDRVFVGSFDQKLYVLDLNGQEGGRLRPGRRDHGLARGGRRLRGDRDGEGDGLLLRGEVGGVGSSGGDRIPILSRLRAARRRMSLTPGRLTRLGQPNSYRPAVSNRSPRPPAGRTTTHSSRSK